MTNTLVITTGSYYDAIIINCNRNIPFVKYVASNFDIIFWDLFSNKFDSGEVLCNQNQFQPLINPDKIGKYNIRP